jgi:hypothetical protein
MRDDPRGRGVQVAKENEATWKVLAIQVSKAEGLGPSWEPHKQHLTSSAMGRDKHQCSGKSSLAMRAKGRGHSAGGVR